MVKLRKVLHTPCQLNGMAIEVDAGSGWVLLWRLWLESAAALRVDYTTFELPGVVRKTGKAGCRTIHDFTEWLIARRRSGL